MQKYIDTVLVENPDGVAALQAATITVYQAGTTTLAAIYSSNAGVGKSNPFTSDSLGRIEFYAADGRYDILVEKTGYASQTIYDVLLEDPVTASDATFNNVTLNGNTTVGDASSDTLTIAPNAVTWSNDPTHSGNHTFSGNVSTQGNTTVGDAAGDAFTVNPSAVTWSNNPTHSGNHTFSGRTELVDLTSASLAHFNDFRLTLTTGTPVTTSDVTAATTIYCTPYKGNAISLYTGTKWNVYRSGEFTLALGTLTASLPYDIFCYVSGGVPTLELLAWTSATARATALARQDGVLIKTGDATRRYLGTFFTTSTTTTEDSVANRYLWNMYHRVPRKMRVTDATATWTWATASWQQARATATNLVNFVIGVSEDAVQATVTGFFGSATAGVAGAVGVGYDVTNADSSSNRNYGTTQIANVAYLIPTTAVFNGYPAAGKHYLAWIEFGGTGITFSGNSISGLNGWVMG